MGDFIDGERGQVKVVKTVRSMIDAGHARSVMGNHEFNAIGYATLRGNVPGDFLRPHTPKNVKQHAAFLGEVGEGSDRHRELVGWFKSLPPTLDLGGIRVVHAWWHQPYVDLVAQRISSGGAMCDDFLHSSYAKGSPEWEAMEGLTKGLEIQLPDGHSFPDHRGVERHEVRTKWWHQNPRSYRDVAIIERGQEHCVPDCPLPAHYTGTPVSGSPIFIGHYWMTGQPALQSSKVACVDYSAAKYGPLVAYRWDGEQELDPLHFVTTG